MPSSLCPETDPRVENLRRRLDEFYSHTTEYTAFKEVNVLPQFWDPIREDIRKRVNTPGTSGPVRVLEFGAGTTGFGEYLGTLRPQVDFTAQDVTAQNTAHLKGQADHVHVGDVLALNGPYDVVFSTFVWEHVTNPRRVLEHLLRILTPGGTAYFISPRYDAPGYLPPTARHYGLAGRVSVMADLMLRRAKVMLGARPQFAIHIDPSMFHKPWYRDADAVHWVSAGDLRKALPPGYGFTRLRTPTRGPKQWVWGRFLLLFARITKPTTEASGGSQPT